MGHSDDRYLLALAQIQTNLKKDIWKVDLSLIQSACPMDINEE